MLINRVVKLNHIFCIFGHLRVRNKKPRDNSPGFYYRMTLYSYRLEDAKPDEARNSALYLFTPSPSGLEADS
jgi:hypothetical protein